jgi:cytochrome c556
MKSIVALILAASAASFATPSMAQFAKPEDAVKYRQSAMTLMSAHLGRLGAMASGKVPFDVKQAADNAAVVEFVSKLPWAGFVEGSEKVGNTRALPEIWSQSAKFKETSDKLVSEAAKLNAAVKVGTLDSLKGAIGGVGGTCKSCHDNFRAN